MTLFLRISTPIDPYFHNPGYRGQACSKHLPLPHFWSKQFGPCKKLIENPWITVIHSRPTSQFFVYLPCPSSNLVYRSLKSRSTMYLINRMRRSSLRTDGDGGDITVIHKYIQKQTLQNLYQQDFASIYR